MSTDKKKEIITITTEEAGQRLDKILVARFAPEHSRTYFHHLIEKGFITLNGQKIKKQHRSEVGDVVAIEWVVPEGIQLTAEDIPLDVIYEDEFLLIVNKPAGMVVHPGAGHRSGTFVNALLHHCGEKLEEIDDLRPGVVHRLDKETSGLLLAAKDLPTHQKLISLFTERKVQKDYLAVCVGNPGFRTVDAPIGRHSVHRKEMAVRDQGKEAVTQFVMMATDGKLSVVRAHPLTGRTHQIRVHLSHLRTPILGDRTYGCVGANKKYGVEGGQLLHAQRLRFTHPATGLPIDITAPLPAEMQRWVDNICRFS